MLETITNKMNKKHKEVSILEKKKRAGDLAKPQDNLVLKHYITTDKAALRSWPLGPSAHIFKTQVSQAAKFIPVGW